MKRRRFLISALAVASYVTGSTAFAKLKGSGSKTIKIIVPFAAGGSTDAMARIFSGSVSHSLGETVIVDDRPGASGEIAATAVARSAPDGTTILLGTIAPLAINPALRGDRLTYDPLKDLSPVMLAAKLPLVFVVPSDSSFKSLGDLTKYLRAGNKATYGSAGIGSSPHMAGELYKKIARVNAIHVPYKGGAPALLDLMAGRITFMVAVVPEAKPLINSGKLRALAVTTSRRLPEFPDVPTASEAGLPGYDVTSWYGFVVRAGTPKQIISRLNAAFNAALKEKSVSTKLTKMGFQIVGGTPSAFGQLIRSELKRWKEVIKEAHISVK